MVKSISIFDEGPPASCPEVFNLAAHTFVGAADNPDKIALEVIDQPGVVAESWSYGALQNAVLATAAGLMQRGIKQGDRVLLRLGNTSEFPILFFAANAIGAVPVPTSSMLTAAEVVFIIEDAKPTAVFLGDGFDAPDVACPMIIDHDEILRLRENSPASYAQTHKNDPAFMIYTSGTDGRPKGVVHAQRAGFARRMMWDDWYGLTSDDRVLHAGAFNWTYTLGAGLMDPWAIGATALIYNGPPDKGVWADIADKHQATIFAATPGVFRQLLTSGADCKNSFARLRHAICAGENLAQEVRDQWQNTTDKPIFEALGMSEISTYISSSPTVSVKQGATGRPQKGRRVAVLGADGSPAPIDQTGLLAVGGDDPGLMLGYTNTGLPLQDGWFITGDRASMDGDGYITFHGRDNDLMNAQGYRVSPLEVEAALLTHPAIIECAVVELPVKQSVTIIAAFYVADGEGSNESDLQKHCAGLLAGYKCPKSYKAVNELPRSVNGKLLHRALVLEHGWKAT